MNLEKRKFTMFLSDFSGTDEIKWPDFERWGLFGSGICWCCFITVMEVFIVIFGVTSTKSLYCNG